MLNIFKLIRDTREHLISHQVDILEELAKLNWLKIRNFWDDYWITDPKWDLYITFNPYSLDSVTNVINKTKEYITLKNSIIKWLEEWKKK